MLRATRALIPVVRARPTVAFVPLARAAIAPVSVGRRSYVVRAEPAAATAASTKKDSSSGYLNFDFRSPTTAIYPDKPVYLVQLAAVSGDMAVLGGHQHSIVQVRPGVVGVQEEQSGPTKRWFVPGGFCVIKDNTASLTVNEAVPVDDLDLGLAKQGLIDQTAALAVSPEGSVAKVRAQVGIEVYTALIAAIESK